jgi:enoyl-CoA hydratase/carnithine racemase
VVDLEVDQGLAIITIDRPHARNAIATIAAIARYHI